MGDWEKAPSGQNQTSKLALLGEEGVEFDGSGLRGLLYDVPAHERWNSVGIAQDLLSHNWLSTVLPVTPPASLY
jgi:hypothetical protein